MYFQNSNEKFLHFKYFFVGKPLSEKWRSFKILSKIQLMGLVFLQ